MIKCNSPKAIIFKKCVIDMDGFESQGGTICCNTAEDCNNDKNEILKRCEYAEPTNIHDAVIKELWN